MDKARSKEVGLKNLGRTMDKARSKELKSTCRRE